MVWILLLAHRICISAAVRPHIHAFQHEMVIPYLAWPVPHRFVDMRHFTKLHNPHPWAINSWARERWDFDRQFCSGVPCDAFEETPYLDGYRWIDVSFPSTSKRNE